MNIVTLNARRARLGRFRVRSGFTLIELLTVIAIIGMLGAISITTVRGAIQSAKETQTRTTVAKIDSVITGIYEKYQYRKLDVSGTNYMDAALNRVFAMRDLLRCDMPCTFKEVDASSALNGAGSWDCTPLQGVYRREFVRAGVTVPDAFVNLNAELLYLVVMNADPEARSTFSDREVADTDNNGLMEFVDGWGNPIRWMRWAPGLVYSDRQPFCYEGDDEVLPEDSDPFDPLDIIWNLNSDGVDIGGAMPGWFLVPYVYSAGPDGEYGLVVPEDLEQLPDWNMNDPFTFSRSYPKDTAGSPLNSGCKDNIDNHTLIR